MKPNNTLLKVYSVFITLIALALWVEVQNLNIQLDEEVELKYENSAIIDSLLNEQEYIKEYEKPF
jgi:beta-lactamase class A